MHNNGVVLFNWQMGRKILWCLNGGMAKKMVRVNSGEKLADKCVSYILKKTDHLGYISVINSMDITTTTWT